MTVRFAYSKRAYFMIEYKLRIRYSGNQRFKKSDKLAGFFLTM